jgi:hypothetical protein
MALSFSAAKANVKRHFYTVYMRLTTTACSSSNYDTLEHWNTFIATFNAIGSFENESLKIDETPNVTIIDYGEEKIHSYEGNIELKYLQSTVDDLTDLAEIRGADCDMLLVDSINLIFFYIHDKRFLVEKHFKSGQVANFIIKAQQIAGERSGSYSTIHTYGTIPTV